MEHQIKNKKQNQGQASLYKLLRLQNRQNNFVYRDQTKKTYLKVSYPHFPLQTIAHCDLLRIFWKFITTHYFKIIDKEQIQRLEYLKNIFMYQNQQQLKKIEPKIQIPAFIAKYNNSFKFWSQMEKIYSPIFLKKYTRKNISKECIIQLKQLFFKWCQSQPKNKTKYIKKIKKSRSNKTENEQNIDELLEEIDEQIFQQQDQIIEQSQILILQHELEKINKIGKQLVENICNQIIQQQLNKSEDQNQNNLKSLEWLIYDLQSKQISQSINKIMTTQKRQGQNKFVIHFQNALNINPIYTNQHILKYYDRQRQISLLKFYRTGIKSLFSYICHNEAGFYDVLQNRMNLAKLKQKDYIASMKRNIFHQSVKTQFNQFDICHHCKFILPYYLLTTCRFTSQKQTMPKNIDTQTDFAEDNTVNSGRFSQRFVIKQKNCITGYAKINQQYVCGRKFCHSCIKDNYGAQWWKANNGQCPFCYGLCTCTRCSRNEKITKLKSFFVGLGGNHFDLLANSPISMLTSKKQQTIILSKPKSRKLKHMVLTTQNRRIINKKKALKRKMNERHNMYRKQNDSYKKQINGQDQTERWSSSTDKQNKNNNKRISSRKIINKNY